MDSGGSERLNPTTGFAASDTIVISAPRHSPVFVRHSPTPPTALLHKAGFGLS